jgi:hypothetical protein
MHGATRLLHSSQFTAWKALKAVDGCNSTRLSEDCAARLPVADIVFTLDAPQNGTPSAAGWKALAGGHLFDHELNVQGQSMPGGTAVIGKRLDLCSYDRYAAPVGRANTIIARAQKAAAHACSCHCAGLCSLLRVSHSTPGSIPHTHTPIPFGRSHIVTSTSVLDRKHAASGRHLCKI